MKRLLLVLLLVTTVAAHEGHGRPVLSDAADAEAGMDIRQISVDAENGTWLVKVHMGDRLPDNRSLDVSLMADEGTFYIVHLGPSGSTVMDQNANHIQHKTQWINRTLLVSFAEPAEACGWGIAARTGFDDGGFQVVDAAGGELQQAWQEPAPCVAEEPPIPEPQGASAPLALLAIVAGLLLARSRL